MPFETAPSLTMPTIVTRTPYTSKASGVDASIHHTSDVITDPTGHIQGSTCLPAITSYDIHSQDNDLLSKTPLTDTDSMQHVTSPSVQLFNTTVDTPLLATSLPPCNVAFPTQLDTPSRQPVQVSSRPYIMSIGFLCEMNEEPLDMSQSTNLSYFERDEQESPINFFAERMGNAPSPSVFTTEPALDQATLTYDTFISKDQFGLCHNLASNQPATPTPSAKWPMDPFIAWSPPGKINHSSARPLNTSISPSGLNINDSGRCSACALSTTLHTLRNNFCQRCNRHFQIYGVKWPERKNPDLKQKVFSFNE